MLGYSRELIAYRLFDIDRNVIIEERNVIFCEIQKGSKYIKGERENKDDIQKGKSK